MFSRHPFSPPCPRLPWGCTIFLPSRRHLHSSARPLALLVDSSISVSARGVATEYPPRPPAPPLPPVYDLRPNQLRRSRAQDVSATRDGDRELDSFLLHALAQLRATDGDQHADLSTLLGQFTDREGAVLPHTLAYESTPSESRRVRVGFGAGGKAGQAHLDGDKAGGEQEQEQDGIVVVAHVVGGAVPVVAVCSGFCVGERREGQGDMIVTCAHTLQAMARHLPSLTKGPPPASATLVLTSTGHIYPVDSLLSSLRSADLTLLSLSPTPLRDPNFSHARTADSISTVPRLRSLPMSPYPAPAGTRVATHVYQLPRVERVWALGRVVEYKDAMGRLAETGTYDDLTSMSLTTIPTPGSSGGPIVDLETGAVVGVVRGSRMSYGDRAERGFGTPGEKVFEIFQLPGFEPKSARDGRGAQREDDTEVERKRSA